MTLDIADPDVHRVLFESEVVVFLEVEIPPELDVTMHRHPYPSMFARDTGAGPSSAGISLQEPHLDPVHEVYPVIDIQVTFRWRCKRQLRACLPSAGLRCWNAGGLSATKGEEQFTLR